MTDQPPRHETWDAWFRRYDAFRRERGYYSSGSYWRTWISPRIGRLDVRALRPVHVEQIRDALDVAIDRWRRAGGVRTRGSALSGVSAMHVWWTLTGACNAARRSKRRDLRVLDGAPNPCAEVEAPGDRETRVPRRKTFIYPVEAARLFACAAVPRSWRELYAVAAYTYLRPGELRVLRWTEVDLEHRVLHVSRAWHYLERAVKPPKRAGGGVRELPLAAHVVPLLQRMRRTATSELVLPILSARVHETLAHRTRGHLWVAGVRRRALHVTTLTTARASFRSFRDSGITWLAMSGVGAARIMRRAGHDDVATTMRYVKRAEDLAGELGAPFGRLPAGLFSRRR